MDKLDKLTYVCIPAYNEELTIREVIEDVIDLYPNDPLFNIAVVDNASTDNTAHIVRELYNKYPGKIFLKHVPQGCGITGVYISLFRFAYTQMAQYIIGMDAGYSHDPKNIPAFIDQLDHYDCVFGSRSIGTHKAPIERKLVSKVGHLLSNTLLGLKSTDATSGFVGFRREVIEKLPFDQFQSKWHFYDTELKYYCKQLGFKCTEVPIDYLATSSSFKYVHLKEAARTLAYLSVRRLERGLKKPTTTKL